VYLDYNAPRILRESFVDGDNCITFSNIGELNTKIDKCKNPSSLIANGKEALLKYHLSSCRAKKILDDLTSINHKKRYFPTCTDLQHSLMPFSKRVLRRFIRNNGLKSTLVKVKTVLSNGSHENKTTKKRSVHLVNSVIKRLRGFLKQCLGLPPVSLEEMPNCPALFQTYRHLVSAGHKRVPGGWIYEEEFYPDYLTVGGNSFAIRRTALKYCRGQGLDIGAGYWPLPGSTPIDMEQGPGIDNNLEDIPPNSQDYVFSSHCLEHISEWEKALDAWISKVKSGGILFLYLPHPSCKLWHMSNPFMKNIHKWVPDPERISKAVAEKGLTIIDKDDGPDHFFSFFVCARKTS
jgi:hypothetical protein